MKHIKKFEGIRDWFKNEGDDFVKKLLDIIEKENIQIEAYSGIFPKSVTVDDRIYKFDISRDDSRLIIYDQDEKKISEVRISDKYYWKYRSMFEEQQRRKNIENLPDLSDLGRSAKKYNL